MIPEMNSLSTHKVQYIRGLLNNSIPTQDLYLFEPLWAEQEI